MSIHRSARAHQPLAAVRIQRDEPFGRRLKLQISGFLIFIASVGISRWLNETAYRKLDSEQKLRLMDGFSGARAYAMIPLLVLIAIYVVLMSRSSLDRKWVTGAYFVCLFAYLVVRVVLTQIKLTKLDMPRDYQWKFNIGQAISFAGIAWMIYTCM